MTCAIFKSSRCQGMGRKYGFIICSIVDLLILLLPQAHADSLVVYSAREEHLIKPLFDLYEQQTGHTITYVTDKAGRLMYRFKAEGRHSPADLFITVDAGHLWIAAKQGHLSEVVSPTLIKNIPAHLRDPGNRWFGLSMRARTIVYNKRRISKDELFSYENLADPKWKGRLCLRTSKKVYNHSLIAMLINRHGPKKTEQIVAGWVRNLAHDPFPNDIMTMMAIQQGRCDVGIVNSYYFGRLQKELPDMSLALFWPPAEAKGVHVNISGAGVTRYAPHREAAIDFLEWLSKDQAQHLFAKLNMEYPVNPTVEASPTVESWGSFSADRSNLNHAGILQAYAIRLMERAGYR